MVQCELRWVMTSRFIVRQLLCSKLPKLSISAAPRLLWLATHLFRLDVLVHSPHVGSVNGGVACCLPFVLPNISGWIDYTVVSYTASKAAFKVISNIITNSNVCDETRRMDDTVSEKSQSSETSRTPVNPEVSQSFLSPVVIQPSDVSRFEIPMGSRRKDLLPTEKSVDAALLKSHLLVVSRQKYCSKPFLKHLCLLPFLVLWNECRAILSVSVAVSLKLMLVSCLALVLFPQIFL